MIRYQRHTGPISHPVVDPPEDQQEPVPQPWEDEDEDCEGDDP